MGIINDKKNIRANRRAFYMALAFVILSMVPGLFISNAKALAYIAPLIYIFIERKRIRRSWEEIGIKLRDFKKDFFNNWHLIFIVAVVLQLLIALIGKFYWPDLLKHISNRIPLFNSSSIIYLILIIIAIPFFEELIYRGLLQQRLSWYLNGFAAIIIASVVFGLQHFTLGQPAIVAVDVTGVAVDGIFFGLIFARSHNVLVSWTAHVVADLIGIAILMLLV